MVQDLKSSIAVKLLEIQPSATVYDEEITQDFELPAFFIHSYDQDYSKRLGKEYTSTIDIDVAYICEADYLNSELQDMRVSLLRGFDLVGGYRILNKTTTITDGVLHFMFSVIHREMEVEEHIKMKNMKQNINSKEG